MSIQRLVAMAFALSISTLPIAVTSVENELVIDADETQLTRQSGAEPFDQIPDQLTVDALQQPVGTPAARAVPGKPVQVTDPTQQVPQAAAPNEESSAPSAEETGVGMVAALQVGTCTTSGIGVNIIQLIPPTVPSGNPHGSADAIPVATSFTLIDRPFRDLLVGGLVVVIYAETDHDTAIACGAIGGVIDIDGTLTIGLRPMGQSATVGMAYFSPMNDGAATGLSIFVLQ